MTRPNSQVKYTNALKTTVLCIRVYTTPCSSHSIRTLSSVSFFLYQERNSIYNKESTQFKLVGVVQQKS